MFIFFVDNLSDCDCLFLQTTRGTECHQKENFWISTGAYSVQKHSIVHIENSEFTRGCLSPLQKQILIHSGPPSANRPSCTIRIVQCAPSQNWQTLNKNNCGETMSKTSMLDTFCSHSFSLHLFGLRWLPDSHLYPQTNKQPWRQPMKVNVKHIPNCTATYMLTPSLPSSCFPLPFDIFMGAD